MVSTRSSSQTPSKTSSQEIFPTPPPTYSPLKNEESSTKPSLPPISTDDLEMTTTLSKSHSTTIATPAGDLRVRPYRSSSNPQFQAVLSFTPRTSALDRQNTKSQVDEFRGFFTLFWIGLALLFFRTSLESWETNKTTLSWNFGRLITRDALFLAFSDGLMVLSMFLCVPFVKCLQYRYIDYYWTGVVIQHIFQTAYLGVAIAWGWVRDWYWVQSGFLVLHALSNMMKMHSYMAHNGMLSQVSIRLEQERAKLDKYLSLHPGGREAALAEAARHQAELEAKATAAFDGAPGDLTPAAVIMNKGTMTPRTGSGTTGYDTPSEAIKQLNSELQHTSPNQNGQSSHGNGESSSTRRKSSASLAINTELRHRTKKHKGPQSAVEELPPPSKGLPHGTSLEPSANKLPHEDKPPHPLAWSSDEKIAILARNIDVMEGELRSNGSKGLTWPENVTFKHFADFMIIPTLVYQLEYPRTSTMNPLVVVEKIIATFGTFSLIYTITEHYIMPYLPKPEDSLFKSFINLALPMMINYLLIFYIIFECVCAGFAELSYFADREFYQDWWNSTTWDQFSRRWNKPVHTFLLRHVYASTLDGLQLSKMSAAFLTFLLSAACHELVMAVVSKKVRPYLFLMQMAQVPMIALGRLPIVRRNKTIGNLFFWIGLMCGFPLLAIGYLKY